MQLCYVHQDPVPAATPSALQLLQMLDGFGRAGVATTLIAPRSALAPETLLGHALSPQVTLDAVPALRKRWYFPFASYKLLHLALRRRVAARRPPLLYARNLKLAESLLRAFPDIPLFFETHELFAASFAESHHALSTAEAQRKLQALERREAFVYARAAGIVALTGALADDIRGRYGIKTPLLVAPDAVDETVLDLPAAPATMDGEPVWLYLGSLHPWKGVDILVEALPHCRRGTLWIAGGKPAEIARLEARAADLGVARRLRCLGPVPPAERFGVIAQATACLLPSSATQIGSRYTSPLKLFEYLAMGKPVVAAQLPALAEILADTENALLVPAGDASGFAAALDRLAADPAMAAAMGQRNRALAREHTWTRRAERIASFVEGCRRHA